eukprot:248240-Rhodomonas_salina.1
MRFLVSDFGVSWMLSAADLHLAMHLARLRQESLEEERKAREEDGGEEDEEDREEDEGREDEGKREREIQDREEAVEMWRWALEKDGGARYGADMLKVTLP